MTRSGNRARRFIQRPKSATSPVTKWVAWATIAAARSGRSFEDSSGGVSRSTSAGRRLSDDSNSGKAPPQGGQRRRSLRLEIPLGLDDRKGRGQERDAAGRSQLDQERRESVRAVCGGEENVGVEEDTKVSHDRDGAARPASSPSAGGAPSAHVGWRDPPRPGARSPRRHRARPGSPRRDPGRSSRPPPAAAGPSRGEPQACAHGFGQGDLAPRRDDQGRRRARRARSHRSTSDIILAEFLQFCRPGV